MMTLTDNDNHFITYVPEKSRENTQKLKNIRRFQTKNTDSFLKVKFWIVYDKEFATKFGINVDEFEIGDLYYLKGCSKANNLEPTTHV